MNILARASTEQDALAGGETVTIPPGKPRRVPKRDPEWRRPSRRRVLAIRDRLRELYGQPVNEPHGHPIAELVRTILSQNTNDRNRDVAYSRMRERFPPGRRCGTRRRGARGRPQPGGLAPRRPPAFRSAGASWATPRTSTGSPRRRVRRRWTTSPACPGSVARPRPACMIFSFDRPEIPVDTHVHRVGGRLGLFRPGPPSRRPTTRCSRSPLPRTPTSSTST